MLILRDLKLSLDTDFNNLTKTAAVFLKTSKENIESVRLYRKSIDARKKDNVHFCVSLVVKVKKGEEKFIKKIKNAEILTEKTYIYKKIEKIVDGRPVVVGFGPAGMFAAYILAKAGLKPIIIERGKDADARKRDVDSFFAGGKLNTESNVQFGEGGAGTFSDGKLNSGIKDVRCCTVLELFVHFGAPERILYEAKPHIGTDILINVVKNIRAEIIRLGGEVRFCTKLTDIFFENGALKGIKTSGGDIACKQLILAIGHSARDTFEILKDKNVSMCRKPFAMGVRIEHLQNDINTALYGKFADHKALPAADYKLAIHLEDGRGVYTFCMCPGGYVVNSSSEEKSITVNGMSYSLRDGVNANSALLVSVEPSDLEGDDVLEGCRLQREIEQKAFQIGGGAVPVTTVENLLYGKPFKIGEINPTVKPKTVYADFTDIFPVFITDSIKKALPLLDKKLTGFAKGDAILTAPETRSSSPIRIIRDEKGQSLSVSGLYPCGEGAGYAGGIMSAAVDGIKIAEALIDEFNQNQNI